MNPGVSSSTSWSALCRKGTVSWWCQHDPHFLLGCLWDAALRTRGNPQECIADLEFWREADTLLHRQQPLDEAAKATGQRERLGFGMNHELC
eukprot:7378267-Prymnesium_polylepis.2